MLGRCSYPAFPAPHGLGPHTHASSAWQSDPRLADVASLLRHSHPPTRRHVSAASCHVAASLHVQSAPPELAPHTKGKRRLLPFGQPSSEQQRWPRLLDFLGWMFFGGGGGTFPPLMRNTSSNACDVAAQQVELRFKGTFF